MSSQTCLSLLSSLIVFVAACLPFAAQAAETPASCVPTFHCMSLYWPREDGAVQNRCEVRFRVKGTEDWREGQELWWDAVHRFYAGAVVGLLSGTDYEFELELAGGATTQFSCKTWPDQFPVSRIVKLPPGTQSQPLVITEGGGEQGYVVYDADAAGTVIDADPSGGDESDAADNCVVIDADYVILRGLTLRNAKSHAVLIKNCHDLVIEACDISNWGRRDPRAGQNGIVNRYAGGGKVEVNFAKNLANQMDSAIKGQGATTHDIERVIVQGNRIHHPRYGANSWSEGSSFFNSFHPQGAKAVCLFRPGEELPTKGNHVIRYNEFYSDRDRMFYDILFDSQGSGPLQGTDAQRDIDIYGNVFRDCIDDCMELERGFGNIRVFENWFDNVFKASTCFTSQSGPYYMFRNVFDRVLQPSRTNAPDTRAWTGCAFQSGERRFYFYHNTFLCPGGEEGDGFCWAYGNDFKKIGEGRGIVDDGNFTVSRNNIYQTIRWPDEVNFVTRRIYGGFSFDYELYNGVLDANNSDAIGMWGQHAINGEPVYREGNGSGHVGLAQLASNSPGKDAGVRIPNFNDDFEGEAPDIGAHEHGSLAMKLGIRAYADLYKSRVKEFVAEARSDSIIIKRGDSLVAEYFFRDATIPRPYFAHLHAPDGTRLTRSHPPVKGSDATDHDKLHPGLWLAFGDLNGVDFWRNKGHIEHVRFVSEPRIDSGKLGFSVEEKYTAPDGSEVCRGINEFAFIAGEMLTPQLPGTLLLWSTKLQRADGAISFGPQHEMGLGFRIATPLIVKGGSGRILGSHGGKDEVGNWGREGKWWNYSGTNDGRHSGILAVAAKENQR